MKLACLTEDTPPAFANLYSNKVNTKLQSAKQAELDSSRETDVLMKKLDEDIARVLEQEQSSGVIGVDHNADKKVIKAPLVQLEAFDLDSTEDTASSTSSVTSPRFPDLSDVNQQARVDPSLLEASDIGQGNTAISDESVSTQRTGIRPDEPESGNVPEESPPEEEEPLTDFQVCQTRVMTSTIV
jgi:hypothetical protein